MKSLIRKWGRRLLISGLVLVLLLALGGACYQWVATRRTELRHPAPGTLIDVGGHRLHIHLQGAASPTVVIDAGLSGASYDWENVAKGIATFTQVCTYDRAGYGWSDAGPTPRTSQRAVEELHTLLQKAQVKPPFILVGHSWAGLNARLYASEYPEDIAGLVLVDALNYDLDPDTDIKGQVSKQFKFLNWTACLGSSRLAVPKFVGDPANDVLARDFRWAMLSRTKSAHAIYSELTGQSNWLSVRSATKNLGDKLVMVISRHIDSADLVGDEGEGYRQWVNQQQALLGISKNTKRIVANTQHHNIQFYEPDLIVDSVREMVAASRKGSSSKP